MMGLSVGHLLILMFLMMILLGANKVPKIMADLARSLKSFKENMNDEPDKERDDR